jgi:hypothetical protein
VQESNLDHLYVLVGALKVLGLEGAAQSYVFVPRLSAPKQKISSRRVASVSLVKNYTTQSKSFEVLCLELLNKQMLAISSQNRDLCRNV